MLRRSTNNSGVVAAVSASSLAVATLSSAARFIRATTLENTLKDDPGTNQGTFSVRTGVFNSTDADNEAKLPKFRMEVAPRSATAQHSYLSSMYKWGFNSSSLFHHMNELPGAYASANDTSLMTSYTFAGDFAASGLHSGIWPFVKGQGQYNTQTGRLRKWAYGRSNSKKDKGTIRVNWQSTLDKKAQQNLIFPHTKEHDKHKRIKNPALKDFAEIKEAAHGKRILRECQYHLAQGIRHYLVDGYFGSHPGTATSFRVFTDNPDHAYLASMNAIRNKNIKHFNGEHSLAGSGAPAFDEWCWRRPSVLAYHCPSFDFELPRIVEEFGGPRPQDMSLTTQQFNVIEPYSIPMKTMIGAIPDPELLFNNIGFLAARWGFYADDRRLLTLPNSESFVNAANNALTVFVNTAGMDLSALRQSPFLYGSRHHRLGQGVISRAWDGTSFAAPKSANSGQYDLIDEEYGVLHRPLSTRVNSPAAETNAFSHRLEGRPRGYNGLSFKRRHSYTSDSKAQAASSGMLFGAKSAVDQTRGRASAFALPSTKIVVIGSGGAKGGDNKEGAAKAIVEGIIKNSMLYAEEAALVEEFKNQLETVGSVEVVSQSEAQSLMSKLAKNGGGDSK